MHAAWLINVCFNWLVECRKPSIICVTETWLNDSISESEFLPPGYSVLRNDRTVGCVALFISKDIKYVLLPELLDSESVWCKIDFGGFTIVIGAVYRPPNDVNSIHAVTDFIAVYRLQKSQLIICGDFNAPYIDWPSFFYWT